MGGRSSKTKEISERKVSPSPTHHIEPTPSNSFPDGKPSTSGSLAIASPEIAADFATFTKSNGDVYTGQILNGLTHGRGVRSMYVDKIDIKTIEDLSLEQVANII